jgi:hypothetical protein
MWEGAKSVRELPLKDENADSDHYRENELKRLHAEVFFISDGNARTVDRDQQFGLFILWRQMW